MDAIFFPSYSPSRSAVGNSANDLYTARASEYLKIEVGRKKKKERNFQELWERT
jgi:hypothetical protein